MRRRHGPRAARYITTVLGVALLAACAASSGTRPSVPGTDGLPDGHTYVSTSVTDNGRDRPLVPGTSITIRFTSDSVTAAAGCNTLSGHGRVNVGRLVVDNVATTLMGCDQPRTEQDSWLAAFLTARPTLAIDGATLTLSSESVTMTMTDRNMVQPNRALVGPRWIVDTLIDHDTASSVPVGITAELIFAADGHVTGTTGCRDLSGSYTRAGGTVTFGPITTGKRACTQDTVDIDRAVLKALTGTVTVHIDADRLTLTAASGAGLSLTAH